MLLDFNSICKRTQTNANNDASKAEISIPKGSFVAVPRCFRQPGLPESTFYPVKIVNDITDTTDEQVHVKGEWYFQDVIEPLFFVTTSEVEFVSRKVLWHRQEQCKLLIEKLYVLMKKNTTLCLP